jgi:hypothetical protein
MCQPLKHISLMESRTFRQNLQDSFKTILIFLFPVFLLNLHMNGQEMTFEERKAKTIVVDEDKVHHTFTIKQGNEVLWTDAKFALPMGDCYLILTHTNEKILINYLGEKQTHPSFYSCGRHGDYWIRYRTIVDSGGWYFVMAHATNYSGRKSKESVTKTDSLPKKNFRDVYFYNHEKRISIYNKEDRIKRGRKGIWFQGSLDWYDEIFYREGSLFRVEKNGCVGFYKITPIHYETIEDFDLGLARFTMKNGKTGYVDMKGNEYFD